MKRRISRALCVVAWGLLALPAVAGAHARPIGRPATVHSVSGRAHVRSADRGRASGLVRRLHLSVRHTAAGGHFDYPLGVAANAAGDVFVANYGDSYINEITPTYTVPKTFKITQDLSGPISLATDPAGDIYVGNINGGVQEFSVTGAPAQLYTANAGDPSSIAVDQFGDLYIAGAGSFAIDDPYGESLYSSVITGGTTTSLALGGAYAWSFEDGAAAVGNGSVALRQGALQYTGGSLPFSDPVGATCSVSGTCWIADESKTLTAVTYDPTSGTFRTVAHIALPYVPAGIAYSAADQRLYIADPVGERVDVYNAGTLALIKAVS